jgi:hypothetical protein
MMQFLLLQTYSAVYTHLQSGVRAINTILLQAGQGFDDPGMPGGDPDLPETPLDSGLYVLIVIALVYGVWRIRALRTMSK